MADESPGGGPKRVRRYLIPRNASRLSLLSAGAAVVIAGAAFGAYASGWHEAASPGPVAAAHSIIGADCAECHQSQKGAVDLRCERCHDPLDSRRYGSAAHVLTGSDDRWKAAHAETVACAACHVEHRGHAAEVAAVDDATCARCHTFGEFGSHPEFAMVRSAAPSSNGLEFSHASHLKTLAATGEDRCERCHQPTADQRGFQPISFERFCAGCHLKNGVLTINGTDPAETSPFAADLLQPLGQPHATVEPPDGRGRQKLTNLPHADPWLLERVARLAAVIDAGGAIAADRRARIEGAIHAIEAASGGAVAGMSADDLARWAAALTADLDAIDRQIAGPRGEVTADAKARLTALAGALASLDPTLPADVASMASSASTAGAASSASSASSPASADDLRRAFEARRAELTALLDAVRQSGTTADGKTATALEQRLAALGPGPAPAAVTPADRAALLDRLASLDQAVSVVDREEGAAAGLDLGRALALARAQIDPGADPAAIAGRQAELAHLLDALAAQADPLLRRQITGLRTALDELASGSAGDAALRTHRADQARLLDRVSLELELAPNAPGPTPAVVREEAAVLHDREAALQAELARLGNPAATLPPLNVSADDARKGVKALLYACMTCHRLDPDGTSIEVVQADLRQLTAASFSHAPHLAQTKCETCHAGVASSTSGEDALMPGVATCQTCHKPSQARANCASCHLYHAQPLTAIGATTAAVAGR